MMTYYAKPGKEDAVYQGVVAEDRLLIKHGVEGFTVLRGPGGTGPAVQWEMTFATMAAHDAWYKQSDKVLPASEAFEASILRMEHLHYKFIDGWTYSPCK
jgi:hypothetical protein